MMLFQAMKYIKFTKIMPQNMPTSKNVFSKLSYQQQFTTSTSNIVVETTKTSDKIALGSPPESILSSCGPISNEKEAEDELEEMLMPVKTNQAIFRKLK